MQFALNPKEAKSSTEEVFADYLAVEGHLRTQTGAMNHARAPRKSPSPQPPAQPSQGLPSSSLASPARTSAPPFTTAKPAAAKKSPPPSTAACYVAQPIDNESPLKTQLSPPRPPPDHTSFDAAAHTQAPKHMHQSLSHLSKQHTRRVSAAAAPSGIDGGPSSAAPVSPPQDASLPTSLAQRPHTFGALLHQYHCLAVQRHMVSSFISLKRYVKYAVAFRQVGMVHCQLRLALHSAAEADTAKRSCSAFIGLEHTTVSVCAHL